MKNIYDLFEGIVFSFFFFSFLFSPTFSQALFFLFLPPGSHNLTGVLRRVRGRRVNNIPSTRMRSIPKRQIRNSHKCRGYERFFIYFDDLKRRLGFAGRRQSGKQPTTLMRFDLNAEKRKKNTPIGREDGSETAEREYNNVFLHSIVVSNSPTEPARRQREI